MLAICGPADVDGMMGFTPQLVGILYGVADNVLRIGGCIVIFKYLCAPPPILLWTEDSLAFRFLWT